MISFTVKARDVRRLTNSSTSHLQSHFLIVPFEQVPDFPNDINLRTTEDLNKAPRETSVYGQLTASILQKDPWEQDYFYLRNKGIVAIASSVTPVEGGERNEFIISMPENWGIIDGGHTAEQIKKHGQRPDGSWIDECVIIHIITGFEQGNENHEKIIHQIARGQNTSEVVQLPSITHHLGGFDWIKEELSNTSYSDRIKYSENERGKYIDVRDIICSLSCMDISEYPIKRVDAKHSILSATGRTALLQRFVNRYQDSQENGNLSEYEAMRFILADVLRLRNIIAKDAPKAHNALGGRAGSIEYIRSAKSKTIEFPFLLPQDKNNGDKIDSGVIKAKDELFKGPLYPILASFRCMLEKDENGYYRWDRDFEEVIEVWNLAKSEIMGHIRVRGKDVGNLPDSIAKSPSIWQTLVTTVILTSGTFRNFQ